MNSLRVSAATLNANGTSVTLDTDPQTANTLYTIAVESPADLALNPIAPNTTVQFRSWVATGCSALVMDVFRPLSTTDNTLSTTLLADPNFPNNPAESLALSAFDTRTVYPDDSHEGYGARIHGLFIPPTSGNWVFYLASDDSSRLFFNPNGPAASGKLLIQEETGCCNGWAAHTSAPQALIGGQGYYIEAIYKEGVGGDYCKVAARLQSQGPPTDDPDGQQTVSAFAIPGGQLGVSAVPMNVVGPVSISTPPASQSVEEHTLSVTFSVGAFNSNGVAFCYQWQRSDNNGPFADLPGATKSSVSISFPTIANDNGDQYRCVVLVPGASTISAPATLTVTADVTRPRLTCVLATSATTLVLYFSEPLDPNSMDPFNFGVNQGVSVANAAQNAGNPLRVDVTTSPMTLGNAYQVTVYGPATAPGGGGVFDAGGNVINPDPSTASVIAQNYGGNPDTLKTLPSDGCLPLGCLTTRGFNCRIYQLSTAIANDNATAELILSGAAGPNIAPVGAQSFMETGVINYNKAIPGADLGHILGDVQFPGYPPNPTGVDAGYENMVMEALCYVELKAGIHRWIVNSDDGFRVYAGLTPGGPILGEFNGGRGSADTVFEFIVKEDCLYPFRLLWEQGVGGANVEWEKEDLNNPGTYVAINGNDSIRAFKVPMPVITAVNPAEGTEGDIITIEGTGFGNCPDNTCMGIDIGGGQDFVLIKVLDASDHRITARILSVPPTSVVGRIMLDPGAGNQGFFQPALDGIVQRDPVWTWQDDGRGGVVAPGNFNLFPAAASPGSYFRVTPGTNGGLCTYISGNWPSNATISVESHFDLPANCVPRHYDLYARDITFTVPGGSLSNCAARIADTVACAFNQRQHAGVIVKLAVINPNLIKLTLCMTNGKPIIGGGFTICVMPPRVPIITSVDPLQGREGEIIVIRGSGFGNNPNNLCMVGGAGGNVPLRVLTAQDDRLVARVGTVGPNDQPGPIMVVFGEGNNGLFQPALDGIAVAQDNWTWRSRQPAAVSPQPFTPIYVPPTPLVQYYHGIVTNGVMCVYLQGDWKTNSIITIETHFNAGGEHYDMQVQTLQLTNPGTVFDCALRISDTLRCSWGQRQGLRFPHDVNLVAPGVAKITIHSPNGAPITSGGLTICVMCPLPPSQPPVLSVGPIAGANLIRWANGGLLECSPILVPPVWTVVGGGSAFVPPPAPAPTRFYRVRRP